MSDKTITMREALQTGVELVQSAFAHVSHGGPTRADAEAWLKRAEEALKHDEALERLREAESFVGSPVNDLFMDGLTGNPRQRWLDSVRRILLANGVEPENLPGVWHTKGLK